jgi:hypothetical protein
MSQYKGVAPTKKRIQNSHDPSTQRSTITPVVQTAMISFHDLRDQWKDQWKKDLDKVMIEPETEFVMPEQFQSEQLFSNPAFLDRLHKEVKTTLRDLMAPKRTEGSLVYNELQKKLDLEAKYKNKFVAIDVKSKELVAEGNTLDEAYANALTNTKSRHLYFRKVGRPYLLRV